MSVCVCVHVHMYACTCVCVMGALKLPQQTPTAAQLLELTKQQHIHLCQFPQNNFHFKLDKKKGMESMSETGGQTGPRGDV